jgi:hypothetical protein
MACPGDDGHGEQAMAFIKAILLGGILTWIVSEAIHAGGASGGYLKIGETMVSGHYLHWSWPLFIVASVIILGILLLME